MLSWSPGFAVPDEAQLVADARLMVRTTPPVERDVSRPRSPHRTITVSPIWLENEGEACLKIVIIPSPVRSRFWTPPASPLLDRDDVARLAAHLVPILARSMSRAEAALDDTLRLWWDERAPLRRLGLPWRGHYGLLSALLADLVRKASAGFDTLEWYASLGVPFEGSLGPDDPTPEQIRASMRERTDAMVAEEELWRAEALDD